MGAYLTRRILQAIPLIFLISMFSFFLIRASGDPMSMYGQSTSISAEDRDRIIKAYGWDKPIIVQYFYWLRDMLQGDMGTSLYTFQPVSEMILQRLPNTLILMGTAFTLTLLIAIPTGLYAAVHQYSIFDHFSTGCSFIAFAFPTFWLGLIAIMLFSVKLQQWGLPYLPAGGMYDLAKEKSFIELIKHLLLPASILAVTSTASYIRYLRSSGLDVIRSDYIRTAYSKGLSKNTVNWRHVFRNAMIPLVTLITMDIPLQFSGALITEQVFAWPGMGRLFVDHAARADYPVLMGLVFFISILVIFFNLVADIVYGFIDPRIRVS